jgi:hypothetical protein
MNYTTRTESYKHEAAKETVASWLGKGRSNHTWTEYPIALHGGKVFGVASWRSHVWMDEFSRADASIPNQENVYPPHINPEWADKNTVPSYAELITRNYRPLVIFDVAFVNERGMLECAVEITHKHKVDDRKLGRIKALGEKMKRAFWVMEMDAEWVLTHVNRPLRFTGSGVRMLYSNGVPLP